MKHFWVLYSEETWTLNRTREAKPQPNEKGYRSQHFRYFRKLSTAGRKAVKFILCLSQERAKGKINRQTQTLGHNVWFSSGLVEVNSARGMIPTRWQTVFQGCGTFEGPVVSLNTSKLNTSKLKVFGKTQNSLCRVLWFPSTYPLILQKACAENSAEIPFY